MQDQRTVHSTWMGRIASYYYLSHKTMAHFHKNLQSNLNFDNLLRVLSDSEEYATLPVRHNEDEINGWVLKLYTFLFKSTWAVAQRLNVNDEKVVGSILNQRNELFLFPRSGSKTNRGFEFHQLTYKYMFPSSGVLFHAQSSCALVVMRY